MIAGVRGSWQTIIADLALILFMVTAAAIEPDGAGDVRNPLPARGEPLAVYRPHQGAPPIGRWLAEQAADERQHLTIVGRYPEGELQSAATAALALSSEAGEEGMSSRIVLEPADSFDLVAVLAFDSGGDWHGDCREGSTNGAQRAPGEDSLCD